jgi:hypothetical protein
MGSKSCDVQRGFHIPGSSWKGALQDQQSINRNDVPLNDYDIAKANKGKTAKLKQQR